MGRDALPKLLLLELASQTHNADRYADENLWEFRSRDKLWNTPNLALLTIGAMLEDSHEIEYVDLGHAALHSYDYDIVMMSPTTSQVNAAYKLAHEFRRRGVKVAMGGPHVTMMPAEASQYADQIFLGESEDIIQDVLSGKKVCCCASPPDLSKTPIPLYGLAKKYGYTSVPVQLSRGCPHRCSFCLSSTIYGLKVRRKSVEQAGEELRRIKELYSNPFVFFTDDNFFYHSGYSSRILDMLECLKIQWYAFTDVSIYQRQDLLVKAYEAGCRKLLIGFESLSEANLGSINETGFKRSHSEKYRSAIDAVQSHGIGVIGSFVVGLAHDTLKTFDELYEFIYDTCLFGTNITVATPFPGTEFHAAASAAYALDPDWDRYDGFTLLYDLPNIKKEAFMEKYMELIQRINSPERMRRVISYFKGLR